MNGKNGSPKNGLNPMECGLECEKVKAVPTPPKAWNADLILRFAVATASGDPADSTLSTRTGATHLHLWGSATASLLAAATVLAYPLWQQKPLV